MNKIYSFLIFCLFAGVLHAQTYVPFPTANAVWTERTGNGEQAPSFYCYGLKNSDTTINSVTYHKLYRSNDLTFSEDEFFGGLREDAKRIYLHTGGAEKLIYDFNLMQGDTFFNPGSGENGVVTMIDSVDVSGQYRKRYSFARLDAGGLPWMGYWIEGIGNSGLGGLIHTFALQPTCDCAINNLCLRLDNIWIYHNPTFSTINCDASILSLHNPDARRKVAVIAPNPVMDVSRLVIEGNVKADRLDVYDSRGWKVRSYVTGGKKEVLIDRQEYAPGLYLYRLSGLEQLMGTGKFTVK